jgi:hypothetical protein
MRARVSDPTHAAAHEARQTFLIRGLRGRVTAKGWIGFFQYFGIEKLINERMPRNGHDLYVFGGIPNFVETVLVALERGCNGLLQFVLIEIMRVVLKLRVEQLKRLDDIAIDKERLGFLCGLVSFRCDVEEIMAVVPNEPICFESLPRSTEQ